MDINYYKSKGRWFSINFIPVFLFFYKYKKSCYKISRWEGKDFFRVMPFDYLKSLLVICQESRRDLFLKGVFSGLQAVSAIAFLCQSYWKHRTDNYLLSKIFVTKSSTSTHFSASVKYAHKKAFPRLSKTLLIDLLLFDLVALFNLLYTEWCGKSAFCSFSFTFVIIISLECFCCGVCFKYL